jgi:hypothetical protein
MHCIFAEGQDEELLCELSRYSKFRGENPYVFEIMPSFTHDNDSFDGVADVTIARDTQVAHDESLTQIDDQRVKHPNIFAAPQGSFSGEDGEKLKNQIESGIPNIATDLIDLSQGGYGWLPPPPIQTEAYEIVNTAPDIIRNLMGVSVFQANIVPDKQMTRGEAVIASGQGGTRQDGDIEKYHDFLCRVAYKLLVLDQQFIGRDREFLYTDDSGAQKYAVASPETLRGVLPAPRTVENPLGDLEKPGIQFVLKLDAAKKLPKNESVEREQAMELVGKLAPFAEMPDPRLPSRPMVNMAALVKGVIKSYHLPNEDEIVPPEPTPEELQAYQDELMKQKQDELLMAIAAGQVTDGSELNKEEPGGKKPAAKGNGAK